MKTNIYLLVLLTTSFLSCKDDTPENEVFPQGKTIEEQLSELQEIKSSGTEQLAISHIDLKLEFKDAEGSSNIPIKLSYSQDGKIKNVTVAEMNLYDYEYNGNELIVNASTEPLIYQLDENGLAIYNNRTAGYYYKNGFLVFMYANTTRTFSYSPEGDLQSLVETLGTKATYTYTDYENNIRQEVLSPSAVHWTFRDSFLGHYSSHLIKTATFEEQGEITTLSFNYTFDDQGRVSEVLINRNGTIGSAILTYSLKY